MPKDNFDASLGLAFSLELFKRYRKSGLLQCEIRRIPGFRGPGIVCMELIEGTIVTSYVELADGKQYPIEKNTIIQLDNEKGPFEWNLTPLSIPKLKPSDTPPPPTFDPSMVAQGFTPPPDFPLARGATPAPDFNVLSIVDTDIPVIVGPLNTAYINKWTTAQRQTLQLIWNLIDGKRSVQQIKTMTNNIISAHQIPEMLKTLVEWKVVVIINHQRGGIY